MELLGGTLARKNKIDKWDIAIIIFIIASLMIKFNLLTQMEFIEWIIDKTFGFVVGAYILTRVIQMARKK